MGEGDVGDIAAERVPLLSEGQSGRVAPVQP